MGLAAAVSRWKKIFGSGHWPRKYFFCGLSISLRDALNMPHTTNFAAPANTQPTYQRGPQTHPKPIDSTNKTSSPLSQALAKIHAHNSCQQRFRRLPRTHQRAPGPPPASPTTSGSIQPCSEGRLHTFDQHSQNGVGSRVLVLRRCLLQLEFEIDLINDLCPPVPSLAQVRDPSQEDCIDPNTLSTGSSQPTTRYPAPAGLGNSSHEFTKVHFL